MARIYKESRYVLQLLIGKSYVAQYDDVKISFYTKNPNNQVMVDNGITIKRNIAEVKIESTLFDNLEEGLIKYIVYGTKDGIPFIEERISNYFLKTPLDFKPGESGTTCNLGIGEYNFGTNDVGTYELYASDDGYDGWSKMFINIYGDDGAIRVRRASDLLDDFANNIEVLDFGWNYYVGGIITEIQEIYTLNGNYLGYATYILDNGFKIYRGKWIGGNDFDSKDQIKLGAYVIVFGRLQNNNGELGLEEGSQVVAYQECGGGSCNLEDKSVTPSMADRDGNNLIVVEESEGYDGLSRVVIDPQTLYNEGVEAGRAEGGESGTTCNIGEGEFEFSIDDLGTTYELYSSQESGYDGWSKVTIRFIDGWPVNVYNAGKIFEDYNNGMSPALGNYSYVCGKITEIQEVNTSADNNYASFTLDNCFKVDKCKWGYWHYNKKQQFESEDQIKVGACAVVYGVFQDNNGSLQFEVGTSTIAAYEECKTVVESKVVVGETGVKFANSQITEISPIFEFSNITDYSYMFYNAPNIATQPISRMVVNGSADYAFYGAQKILLPTFVGINEGASVKHMFGENHAEMYETINIISKDFPKNIICGRVNADYIDLKILKRGNPYIDFSADEDGSLFVNASLKNYIHIKPHSEQDLSWLTNGCTVERMIIGEDGVFYTNPTSRDWHIDNIKYLELKGDYSEYGKYEVNGVYYHPRYFFYSLTGIAGCNGLRGDFYFSDKIGIVDLQNFIRNMGTTDVENTGFRLETATYQQLTDEDISTIKSKGYILYNGNTIV